jgi:hypothetical protein
MINNYRYTFDKGSTKHICPSCGKKRFVKYVDNVSGEYLPDQYGRCDREVNCGYLSNPYKDGYLASQAKSFNRNEYAAFFKKNKKLTPMPQDVLQNTLGRYEQNDFINNVLENLPHIDKELVEKIIAEYFLGTMSSGYMKGATTFPFIDINGKIRAIQVKKFDKNNHANGSPNFIHSMIHKELIKGNKKIPKWLLDYRENEKIISCLFGEHLLNKYKNNPIGLVEAPKTAIYASLYFGLPDGPEDVLWLAAYNLSILNAERCAVLEGRKVILFPDSSEGGKAFDLWNNKAKEFATVIPNTRFIVSDLLEKNASNYEKGKGFDLADFLFREQWGNMQSKSSAFLQNGGKLLIETPMSNTYTVYPSILAYNNRECLPEFIKKQDVDMRNLLPVEHDLKTLTVWF